jgi:hypothetical protein
MRAYGVKIKNTAEWISSGGINEEFLVLAEDMVGAMMFATSHLEEIKTKLVEAEVEKIGDLRVTDIHEAYGVVTEHVCHNHEEQNWIENIAERVKSKRF